ncbi:accessory Sec system protein Asp2 [Clostridium saudiense]|uniref:accessory Sec system protein Asp2 n=1 Tax=Clostridium saudiense TaxID=1414720 RepID=UPI0012B79CEE|nr:accessory Sec system protein Asp2 [Clostridium saudiense]MDU3521530.1 accessory Sec system protein Asp2 [Clostridium saudiense]
MNKVDKLLDLMKAIIFSKFKQRVFKGERYDIKYVLERNKNSKDLIIVFTSCTKVGQKARYNYVRTLDKYKCNKLFILDDFGFDKRGAYYLGENGNFGIEKDVELLIDKTICNLNTNKNIFIGSSKGGYAALYFGIKQNESIIITGAPQYNLGNYLNLPGHKDILKYIMGKIDLDSIDYLNNLMKKSINKYLENSNKIYIHYSIKEETYESDIKDLISLLDNKEIEVHKDIKEYKYHSELTRFFPQYIKNILDEVIM